MRNEEPYAVVLHVRFCEGYGRKRPYLLECFQGNTTKHADTARPRLHKERSQTLLKVTGSYLLESTSMAL